MTVEYLDLADYIAIASEITGLDVATVMRSRISILPTRRCTRRRRKNHPLPDGNKRVAWVALPMFIEINGWSWSKYPSVDDAEHVVLAIASSEWDEERTAAWLGAHLAPETEQ